MTRPAPGHDAHAGFAELAAGYALCALEPADELLFSRHLGACSLCSAQVVEHITTLGHLASSADAGEPPAALLEAIREAVAQSGRSAFYPGTVEPEQPVAPVVTLAHRRRRPSGRVVRWAATATAAAASLVLITSLAVANNHLQEQRAVSAARSASLNAALSTVTLKNTRPHQLEGVRPSVGAVAVVQNDASMGALVVTGFTPTDAAHEYVLWESVPNVAHMVAVGAFNVKNESGTLALRSFKVYPGASTVSVTEEPRTSVLPSAPSTGVVVVGTVAATA